MKKILMLLAMVIMGFLAMAQNPQISYQSVVRDASNRLVTNTPVQVTIEVLNASNVVLYTQGPQTVTTNNNGLMSLLVGGTSEFAALDWSNAKIRTTVVVDGSPVVSTVPVTSVPHALQASSVDPSALANYATKVYVGDTLAYYYTANEVNDTLSYYPTSANVAATYATKEKVAADSAYIVGLIQAQPGVPGLNARIIADSLRLEGFKDKVKTDSTVFADGIAANTQAIIDTAAQIRADLATKANATDLTALENRVSEFNAHVCDSVKDCVNAMISDTANVLRGEVAATYATKEKVAADSAYIVGLIQAQPGVPGLNARIIADSLRLVAFKDKVKTDSTVFADGIAANTQAIIDTASQLRNDLATKVALADTAAALRTSMGNDYVTKAQFTADSTVFADNIAANTQAIIDTASNLRTALATKANAADVYTKTEIDTRIVHDSLEMVLLYTQTMLKVKADSAVFANNIANNRQAIIDTASNLRTALATKADAADLIALENRVNEFHANICDSVKDCVSTGVSGLRDSVIANMNRINGLSDSVKANINAIIDTTSQLRTDLATKVALADTAAALRTSMGNDYVTKAQFTTDSTVFANNIAANTQAIIDTTSQLRTDLATKVALADTAAALRTSMGNDYVTKVKFSEDSTIFAENIQINADNIDTIRIKIVPQLKDSIRENKQAIIDTAQQIRDAINNLDDVYATRVKVQADSNVLHGALIDTAAAIREDMAKTVNDGKLIIYMGPDSLDMFTANDSLDHRIDVLHYFTHQELLDTVLNFIDQSAEEEALSIYGALHYKKGTLTETPIWTPLRDSMAGIIMDYVMEEMMKDTASITLWPRTMERIKKIAPTLDRKDARYYLNKLKELKNLIPADVKEDIRIEIKYRIRQFINSDRFRNEVRSIIKSSEFQTTVNNILSDSDVKSAIINNPGVQSLVSAYLNSAAGREALSDFLETSEGKAALTTYLNSNSGKCALFNALQSMGVIPSGAVPSDYGLTCE